MAAMAVSLLMKILVVDDSKAMRMMVRRTLRQAGYECDVAEAENGARGLEAVAAENPDLVLSDWNMPEMSGIEFLNNLNSQGVMVPFGFVTSESTDDMRRKAASAGALFLIAKPFTVDSFKKALGPLLG